MSGLKPTVDEVMERIWVGRREVTSKRGMDLAGEDIFIVVSEWIWHTILADKRLCRTYQDRDLPTLPVQVSMTDDWVKDGPIGYGMKIYGIPARPSKDLEPHEVRFRAEVSV